MKNRFDSQDAFIHRHVGPSAEDMAQMLASIGVSSLEELISETIPDRIRLTKALDLPAPLDEYSLLETLDEIADKNQVFKNFIGMGYYGTHLPSVIQRNILENPGWYTQYTPYQAEISQGRLEALLNFQTMITDLTGLPVSNASLLDEGTAAAEAMFMARASHRKRRKTFLVSADCHPQTLAVIRTRAKGIGVLVDVRAIETIMSDDFEVDKDVFGVLVQYPGTEGVIRDYEEFSQKVRAKKALFIVAADLLSLTILRSPGSFNADIAIGTTQRFGQPLGFGGPHAAYMATSKKYRRIIPGRLIGASVDADGKPAYRLTLQTREQHIRRDKATSNICTSQVLLAIMAGFFAVYLGPIRLKNIAQQVHKKAVALALTLRKAGHFVQKETFFDTIIVHPTNITEVRTAALKAKLNFRYFKDERIGISLDETTTEQDLLKIATVFEAKEETLFDALKTATSIIPDSLQRKSSYLTNPVFHKYHSEHELLRYIHRLQKKDLSLTTSMIPLGSCTMKLNGTSSMLPITWAKFSNIHPFAPASQWTGYQTLIEQLENYLAEISGFYATTLQPNAGSQGEFTGLSVIRAYHADKKPSENRDICLIPTSAHGTNPASAIVAGMRVVSIACDKDGNIDLNDLRKKAVANKEELGGIMITYPSTHGVFETDIKKVCQIVHENGGLVYLDGANMNAQVGLARPGDYGADICHLNLHKTFAIPHGGGGPGVGPVCATKELAPYLPSHPMLEPKSDKSIGPVASAPFGSPSILPISWFYIRSTGSVGLKYASETAILNANYMANRLQKEFAILFTGARGRVAHEFILDCRPFKQSANITVEDIAKRLMDYGFHAPTMSWPVAGTLMVEPTESESKAELDRFCDAMLAIREEIRVIEKGKGKEKRLLTSNLLKNAPHTAEYLLSSEWSEFYSREQAAYPMKMASKYWPPVRRVDNAYGDRNLFCTCLSVNDYE